MKGAIDTAIALIKTELNLEVSHFDLLTEEERRNLVARLYIKSSKPEAPSSLILKHSKVGEAEEGSTTNNLERIRFHNELAAFSFLFSKDVDTDKRITPNFYIGNESHQFIIIEDLGEKLTTVKVAGEDYDMSPSLVQPLLNGLPDPRQGLIRWTHALARLHATTLNKHAQYESLRNKLGSINEFGRLAQVESFIERCEQLEGLLSDMIIPFDPQVPRELRGVANALSSPKDFLALTHGDPCPDNCFYEGKELLFFDFEFADFRHPLLDFSYPFICFPTCWCCGSISGDNLIEIERAYREILGAAHPPFLDDQFFYTELANACAYWTVKELGNIKDALKEELQMGTATNRQRIIKRLRQTLKIKGIDSYLPKFSSMLDLVLNILEAEWGNDSKLDRFNGFSRSGNPNFDAQRH